MLGRGPELLFGMVKARQNFSEDEILEQAEQMKGSNLPEADSRGVRAEPAANRPASRLASGDQQAFIRNRRLWLHQSVQIRDKREDTCKSLEINPPLLQRGLISARINKKLFKPGM